MKTVVMLTALSLVQLTHAQELYVDMSKVPQGKWILDYPRSFVDDSPIIKEGKRWVWIPPEPKPLPAEWAKVKSFEQEGSLPTLSISKKQLEAEGPIIPLAEFMKEADPSKLDKKAMRRSLLHYALGKAEMAEVSHQPVNMKRFDVPGSGEILEHYAEVWGDRKRHRWLVADILVIEYMMNRRENHWKTGALCGANEIVRAIKLEELGKIKDTFPIGATIAHLYLIPNLPYAVPQDYGSQAEDTPQMCLLNISSLYTISDNYPQWYPDLIGKILAIERKIEPRLANIRIEGFAEKLEKRGKIKESLILLNSYEPRALEVEPTNKRIRKKIADLEKKHKTK